MKATYFAAAAAVALAGMNGTAHAAFQGSLENLGTPNVDLPDLPAPFSATNYNAGLVDNQGSPLTAYAV